MPSASKILEVEGLSKTRKEEGTLNLFWEKVEAEGPRVGGLLYFLGEEGGASKGTLNLFWENLQGVPRN